MHGFQFALQIYFWHTLVFCKYRTLVFTKHCCKYQKKEKKKVLTILQYVSTSFTHLRNWGLCV